MIEDMYFIEAESCWKYINTSKRKETAYLYQWALWPHDYHSSRKCSCRIETKYLCMVSSYNDQATLYKIPFSRLPGYTGMRAFAKAYWNRKYLEYRNNQENTTKSLSVFSGWTCSLNKETKRGSDLEGKEWFNYYEIFHNVCCGIAGITRGYDVNAANYILDTYGHTKFTSYPFEGGREREWECVCVCFLSLLRSCKR